MDLDNSQSISTYRKLITLKPRLVTIDRRSILSALVLLVFAWNIWQIDQQKLAFAAPAKDYLHVDPIQANAVMAVLDEYTPIIHESAIDFEELLPAADDEGFAKVEKLESRFITEPTKLEEEYEVQGGDSITTIAERFDLHVATLVDRNQLTVEDIESIKPGKILIIPPEDTSESKDWLVALNKKKEDERQAAIVASQARASQYSSPQYSSTQGFIVPIGYRYISRGLSSYHMGIDYVANTGTTVKAAQAGRVTQVTSGWAGGFGNSILVDHGGGLTTRYAHLSRPIVANGQYVGQGEVIGYSGNTGYSTGPHLHFETRKNGRAINPF
ncbi:LysM peptidoglycan-binding domain-containing M23 family metallopeptidase [Candidatus Berkelbacteria bacterium]|nr:LysM peptidoglycan-binding domain-containing M23 family metallopeptidase [Candidatus Berkelbacteria bacterium]